MHQQKRLKLDLFANQFSRRPDYNISFENVRAFFHFLAACPAFMAERPIASYTDIDYASDQEVPVNKVHTFDP